MCCDVWKVVEALFVNLKENKARYPEVMEMPPQANTDRENVCKSRRKKPFAGAEPSINKSAREVELFLGNVSFGFGNSLTNLKRKDTLSPLKNEEISRNIFIETHLVLT